MRKINAIVTPTSGAGKAPHMKARRATRPEEKEQ
jgi:hypothetical protein